MGKYMFTGRYTAEGAKGLLSDGGSGRKAAVEAAMASVGGTVESIYFMFGSDDVVVVCELPDDESAAGAAITIGASGMVGVHTTVLLTPDQVDAAITKSPAYRPPGSGHANPT